MTGGQYKFSDAWLLHTILFCSKGAELKSILCVGDLLNHAIFSYEEINEGLNRLIYNGFAVLTTKGRFAATQKAKQYYEKYKMKNEGSIIQLIRMSEIFMDFTMDTPDNCETYISLEDYKRFAK